MEWNSAQLGHFQLTFLATEKGEIALCLLAQAKKNSLLYIPLSLNIWQ